MDKREAKALYKEYKQSDNIPFFDMYFDNEKKRLFIKESPIADSQLISYSEIMDHMWSKDENTINKGHPILGAIIGNMIGGFGTGFLGALAGQKAQGKEVTYTFNSHLTLFVDRGNTVDLIEHYLYPGSIKQGGLLDKSYQKMIDSVDERLYHLEGRKTPAEELEGDA